MQKSKTMSEQAIKELYDSFDVKDLSYTKFRQELKDIIDPKKMVSDLSDIELLRARERMNKIRINRRLN